MKSKYWDITTMFQVRQPGSSPWVSAPAPEPGSSWSSL